MITLPRNNRNLLNHGRHCDIMSKTISQFLNHMIHKPLFAPHLLPESNYYNITYSVFLSSCLQYI